MNFLTSESMTAASLFSPDLHVGEWVRLNSASTAYIPVEEKRIEKCGVVLLSDSYGSVVHGIRLRYLGQLNQVLRCSPIALPATAESTSQQLLEAIIEFKPHDLSMSLIVDEDAEASLVLTSYWPEGTLHVEHFFHFPADEPIDTVVNFYNKPATVDQVPIRQWGWHSPASEFQERLREQLRNGQWPLAHGW